jgi:hypothetical protein
MWSSNGEVVLLMRDVFGVMFGLKRMMLDEG